MGAQGSVYHDRLVAFLQHTQAGVQQGTGCGQGQWPMQQPMLQQSKVDAFSQLLDCDPAVLGLMPTSAQSADPLPIAGEAFPQTDTMRASGDMEAGRQHDTPSTSSFGKIQAAGKDPASKIPSVSEVSLGENEFEVLMGSCLDTHALFTLLATLQPITTIMTIRDFITTPSGIGSQRFAFRRFFEIIFCMCILPISLQLSVRCVHSCVPKCCAMLCTCMHACSPVQHMCHCHSNSKLAQTNLISANCTHTAVQAAA